MAANVGANPKMRYTKLGSTDMVVSNVSLGGAAFGNVYKPVNQADVDEVVQLAIGSGINFIDTAPWYGQGKSEERLGKALRGIPRNKYYLATKVGRYEQETGAMFDFSSKKVLESVEKSLALLQVDYVDLIQVHDIEFSESVEQLVKHTLPALLELKRQGKVRYVGITGYQLDAFRTVLDRAEPGTVDTVLTYCRMNLANQDLLNHLDYFRSKNVGVINASAIAMGLLAGEGCPKWHIATLPMKEASMKAHEFCKARGVDLARLAIEWVFSRRVVPTTLMSIESVQQLKDNLETAYGVAEDGSEGRMDGSEMVKGVKSFFDGLMVTNWENVELDRYWKRMKDGNFKQNLDR